MNYIGAPVVTKQTNPGDLAGPIGARGTHTYPKRKRKRFTFWRPHA